MNKDEKEQHMLNYYKRVYRGLTNQKTQQDLLIEKEWNNMFNKKGK